MSLRNACKAAIEHGNSLSDIIVPKWAETFHCSEEDVKSAWEAVLTERSRQPQNNCEVYDGK